MPSESARQGSGTDAGPIPGAVRRRAVADLRAGVEWICHTLWLVRHREPEMVEFQTQQGSLGYPHYILSRAGMIPDSSWVEALYVMPPSLVDHLRQRCLDLGPGSYLAAALAVGGQALRRLCPDPPSSALGQLSLRQPSEGLLPQAWASLPASGDPHQNWLQAAMVLREGRAWAHYRAATKRGLKPAELLQLTTLWDVSEPLQPLSLFRWSEAEQAEAQRSLKARGWLEGATGLSQEGRRQRDAIESETNHWTERLLGGCSDAELGRLAAEVLLPQSAR